MNPDVKAMRERIAAKKAGKPPPPPAVRRNRPKQKTTKRLPAGSVCYYCGIPLNRHNATVDHVVPLSRGGSNGKRNKVFACRTCNEEKGFRLLSEMPPGFIKRN